MSVLQTLHPAETRPCTVEVLPAPDRVTVKVSGCFDQASVTSARQAIRTAATLAGPVIVLDLSGVTSLSAEGATLLLLMVRHARRLRRHVCMTGLDGQPRSMLAQRRMLMVLDVRDN